MVKNKPLKIVGMPRPKKNPTPKSKQVSASNVASNTKTVSRSPNLSMARGATSVTHREVAIETVNNSSSYAVQSTFSIQPALSVPSHGLPMGSWIPSIAKEYDNYEFTSLKVHFVTTCSTLTPGLTILTFDPNPDGAPPTTFSAARNAQACVTAPARTNVSLDLTKFVKNRKLLTRVGPVTSYPLYDVGRLFVATTAGEGSSSIGYLEFEYTLKLSNPQSELGTGTRAFDLAAPLYPTYSSIGTTVANGTTVYVGTTDASRSAGLIHHYMISSPASTFGSPLFVEQPLALRNADMSYVSPSSGVTYSYNSTFGVPSMKMKALGRYKISVLLPGDYLDLATYGMEWLVWKRGVNMSGGSPTLTTDQTLDANGSLVLIPSDYAVVRGFKTLETAGATSKCDLALSLETYFVVSDLEDRFMLGVGVRNVTEITQNATASYKFADDLGKFRFKIEFIGLVQ